MSRPLLISLALALALATALLWSFEIPRIDATVGAGTLIRVGAGIGAVVGVLTALFGAPAARSGIGKVQTVLSGLLVGAGLGGVLAHYTNRALPTDDPALVPLAVKQVTKTWSGRGVTADALEAGPEGYYIFVETDDGLVRLFQEGGEAPDIGPSRSVDVLRYPGFWGFPRYTLPES